jgi:hypothetical protein
LRKTEGREKINCQRHHPLVIKWKNTGDDHILSSAHSSGMAKALAYRGQHQKTNPTTIMDYNIHKTGVNKSDQMLAYYSFQRKSVKWWMKVFFHLCDLSTVNSHSLHNKKKRKTPH